jgi:HNH endonuclease
VYNFAAMVQGTGLGIKRSVFGGCAITSFFNNISLDGKTGCWNWTGARSSSGYGQMRINYKLEYVHRLSAWIYLKMPRNSDSYVCHRCDNPSCFNPKHLFIGTAKMNVLDAMKKGRMGVLKTECKNGHPYDAANTRISNSRRFCRKCHAVLTLRRYHEKKYARTVSISDGMRGPDIHSSSGGS